ncbi:hypothetical protein Drorol1_Dr00004307 [Drosera rotundifolia]
MLYTFLSKYPGFPRLLLELAGAEQDSEPFDKSSTNSKNRHQTQSRIRQTQLLTSLLNRWKPNHPSFFSSSTTYILVAKMILHSKKLGSFLQTKNSTIENLKRTHKAFDFIPHFNRLKCTNNTLLLQNRTPTA